jgi:uncharacterized protein DUF1302
MKVELRRFYFLILFCILSLAAMQTTAVYADTMDSQEIESADTEEDLAGFDEDEDFGFSDDSDSDELSSVQDETEDAEGRLLSFGGFFKEDIGYSYEHEENQSDFSKIKSVLNLSLDLKVSEDWRMKGVWNSTYDYAYTYFGRDKFTKETLDAYETESEIRDLYLDGSLSGWLKLQFGRQIIAWGESELEQIVDLANPRDSRELGMVDVEDARIPVFATNVTLLFDSFGVNLVAIHEIRSNKAPADGSEFDPLAGLRNVFDIKEEEVPDSEYDNTEYLIRVFKSFNGGDVGLFWADVYQDSYHLDFESFDASINLLSMTPRHKRIQSIGFSGNLVRGPWLFRTEMAMKTRVAVARNQENLSAQIMQTVMSSGITGTTFYSRETQVITTWSEKDLLQCMLGFDYSGFENITFSVEGNLEIIKDHEDKLNSAENSGSLIFHLKHTAMNDTLTSDLFWFHLTEENGDLYRINLDYDLNDALTLSGGAVVYEASKEDAQVYPFRKNDRLFSAIKYSF